MGVGTFVADNREELDALERLAADAGRVQSILLRITPGIDPHTHKAISTGRVDSKFGSAIETGQALDITRYALGLPHIALRGFHCHIGSQIFDRYPFVDAARIMIDFMASVRSATGFVAHELNLGGGLGVPYTEYDRTVDYAAVIRDMGNEMRAICRERDFPLPHVILEPGRSLVAAAGITLYTVGSVKTIPGFRTYVSVDGGMPVETFVGGGAALFTLGVGKLGLHPVFQGEVGDDCYGELIRNKFRESHVDDSLLVISKELKTGISLSFTNEKDRSFLTYRGTNEKISIVNVDVEKVKEAAHIHVTGYAGSINHNEYLELLKKIKAETQATVSFDVGWDSTGEWKPEIRDLFPYIDVLFMNETEAEHYGRKESAEEAAREFARTAGMAVIKMGKKGSIAVKDGRLYQAAPYIVEVVDTTGAGDSFNAGFVYGFLRGKSMEECLKCGNGCGALSVTALGGNTGFPTEEKLETFIKNQETIERNK